MARMKLAIGPAATMAARFGQGLRREARRPLLRGHPGHGLGVRNAGAVGVAVELDVAAEGDRRELPARAVPVVEAERVPVRSRGRRRGRRRRTSARPGSAPSRARTRRCSARSGRGSRRRRTRSPCRPWRSGSPLVDPLGLPRGRRSAVADRMRWTRTQTFRPGFAVAGAVGGPDCPRFPGVTVKNRGGFEAASKVLSARHRRRPRRGAAG